MNRPLIRHCKNCEWSNFELGRYNHLDEIICNVKYEHISNCNQRVQALFCRHYKKKRSDNNGE